MAHLLSADTLVHVAAVAQPEDAHRLRGVSQFWKQAVDSDWPALLSLHYPVSNYMDLQPPVDARATHAHFCRHARDLLAGSRRAPLQLDDFNLAVEVRAQGDISLNARLVREAGRMGTFSALLEMDPDPNAQVVAWAGRRCMGQAPDVVPIFDSSHGELMIDGDEYLQETFPVSAAVPRMVWMGNMVGQGLIFDDDLESTPRLCIDRDEISLLRMSVLPGAKVELYLVTMHPQSGDFRAMDDKEMCTFLDMKLRGL